MGLLSDIEECSERRDICSNGRCLNVMGSFSCVCDAGYKLSSNRDNCIGR